MSHPDDPTDFPGSVTDAIREAIEHALPDAQVVASGGGGHFSIEVTSAAFVGKSLLQSQRLVYSAIAHLMEGNRAAVHAVDTLKTRVPTSA